MLEIKANLGFVYWKCWVRIILIY